MSGMTDDVEWDRAQLRASDVDVEFFPPNVAHGGPEEHEVMLTDAVNGTQVVIHGSKESLRAIAVAFCAKVDEAAIALSTLDRILGPDQDRPEFPYAPRTVINDIRSLLDLPRWD